MARQGALPFGGGISMRSIAVNIEAIWESESPAAFQHFRLWVSQSLGVPVFTLWVSQSLLLS